VNLVKINAAGLISLLLTEVLVIAPVVSCGHRTTKPQVPVSPTVFDPLQKDLQKSYLTLFKISPKLEYSSTQISEMQNYLNQAQNYCTGKFDERTKQYGDDIKKVQDQLKKDGPNISTTKRDRLHCDIQNDRIRETEASLLAKHAIPVAYQNKEAKLELIQKWPGDLKQIHQEIADGQYKKRRWGDVQDIGFRTIAAGQKDDIKLGEESVKQMKDSGLMPPVLKDSAIVDYVDHVAQNVAKHSDLHVPLHVTVLNTKTINAFAIPGGFLFVDRGLLEAADNEAELAGVMGHEIGHVVARHGHKLMEREQITSIFYQAAEIAGVILTGGVGSIGMYYALQYGFEGLGLLLNLNLLGVSREYELQADQLGIQYAWNSGYNPEGFIMFFDKMATDEGYVNSLDWFYDHPPFYERMVDAQREIMFLPKKPHEILNTPQFGEMKKNLAQFLKEEKAKKKSGNQPTLFEANSVPGCKAPELIGYKPGQPIEAICSLPGTNYQGASGK
jgi:hypothetical protein